MIKFFKCFWFSFLISVLSFSTISTVSAKAKRSKKIAKVYKKPRSKKRRAPKAMQPVLEESNFSPQPPIEEAIPMSSDVQDSSSVQGSETEGQPSINPPTSQEEGIAVAEENVPAGSSAESLESSSSEPIETVSSPSLEAQDPATEEIPSTSPESQSSDEQPGEVKTDSSSESSEPISETEKQLSDTAEMLNQDIVTPVTEKTPEEALAAEPPTDEKEKAEEVKKENDFLTIVDALEGAYGQSPLLTAEYQVKAAQMALSGAKREWLPKTAASIGYSRSTGDYVSSRGKLSNGDRSDTNGNLQSGTTQGSITLQQNLYSGGSTTANILSQEKTLDATLATYMITLRDTLFTAIKSFIDLSTRQEVFRLNKANQALLERQLEVAQNRYEFGELTRYDVAATQAKLDKAKADVIAALAEVEIAKATFVKITGITVEKSLEKPAEPSSLLPSSKAEAIQLALKLSPELHKQEALAEAAKAETDKTFGGLLPSFDISASASRKLTDNWDKSYFGNHGKTRREEVEAGATLSIPLDFRGTTQSGVRQQKYVAAQKRLTAIYERRSVMELVSRYWDSLEAARARITQIQSQVNASKIAVETVTEEFLAGNKTTLDVLTAEQELFSAQVELVNAEQSVILNAYQLLATIGRLDAETLGLKVNVYNPSAEYKDMSFWGINIAEDERIAAQEVSTSLMKDSEATK